MGSRGESTGHNICSYVSILPSTFKMAYYYANW